MAPALLSNDVQDEDRDIAEARVRELEAQCAELVSQLEVERKWRDEAEQAGQEVDRLKKELECTQQDYMEKVQHLQQEV